MIAYLVGHWPFVLLAALLVYFAAAALCIALACRSAGSRPHRPAPEYRIVAGGGFRLADARADARIRLGESTARMNTRPTGSCDNVVPLRRPRREVSRRGEDVS